MELESLSLKKKRTTHRTLTTKLLTKIETSLTEQDISADYLSELLEQLNAKEITLKQLNNDIESRLKEDEIESEIITSSEYDEKIISYKTKLNIRIKQSFVTNCILDNSSVSQNSETVQCVPETKTMKLPKLIINKFYGDPDKYLEFWNQFDSSIHKNPSLSNIDKFSYLKSLLGGIAANAVSGFSLTESNYSAAVGLLQERFGRHDMLVHTHLNNLLNITALKDSSDIRGLRKLYDRCETQIRCLEALGVGEDTYGSLLCPILLKLLPADLTLEFSRKQGKDEKWKVESLVCFIRNEIESRERAFAVHKPEVKHLTQNRENKFVERSKYNDRRKMNYNSNSGSKSNISSAAELVSSAGKNLCIFCNSEHRSEICDVISVNQKKQILKSQGRCFMCLLQNHRIRDCPKRENCSFCSGRHNVTLCFKRENCKLRADDTRLDRVENSVSNNVTNSQSKILLQTAAVELIGRYCKKYVRCLFDTGSQRTFIRKKLSRELKLNRVGKEDIFIYAFGTKTPSRMVCTRVEVKLESDLENRQLIIEALEIDEISRACLDFPPEHIARELESRGINLADAQENMEDGDISLLIGADNYWNIVTDEIEHLNSTLVAAKSRLGWVLMGKVDSEVNENFTENETHINSAFAVTSMLINSTNIENLWRLDTLGICDPVETKSRVEIEQEALDYFKKTVSFDKEGRYEIHLPWIEEEKKALKSNIDVAKERLLATSNRLIRRKKFEEYERVFAEWCEDKIIEEVPNQEIKNSCHYLPHRGVFKENSTTKLRPVFDASCRASDSPSLNDCLKKGPNLLEQIPPILRRFRREKIGVISDIRKAFLQISVAETDRDFLRFFMWKDFTEKQFRVFRHRRVVFGLNCSPFLLAAVLNHHIEKNVSDFPGTADLLKQSFYVDNCVTSVPDEDFLQQFIEESTQILASACFDLRGWEHTTLSTEKISTQLIPVLGLLWDKAEDTLSCDTRNIKPQYSNVTRRNVLSIVHKIFDPLGVLCPTTLIPKLIVQKSWNLRLGWDIPLPEELQRTFSCWTADLPLLNDLRIPRSLNIQERGELNLHVICDASSVAYATVIFLRQVVNGVISVHFVEARSRIAPARKITIPRLELLACCIGTRLSSSILKSLDLRDVDVCYWTDSATAIYWIQREDHWSTFVRNRVNEIRKFSSKEKWRHLPGSFNAADLPSRGCSIASLLKSKWWEGPEWLKREREEWPNSKVTFDEEEIAKEKRKVVNSSLACSYEEKMWYLRYFSSYSRIVRMTAWILRFINNCSLKTQRISGELNVQELEAAERKLLKIVQMETLQRDIKIRDLFTLIDEDGIIRLKTKITRRDDDEDFRYPIVLPSDHELVHRLILDYHLQFSHAGTQVVLTNLRQRFWIVRGRKTVQRIISKCVRCRRHTTKRIETLPSPLPENRVRDAFAFEVTGVDVAGPLHLKYEKKAWILLFTCAVYRAVHLELIESLSTNCFLLGFRRFIARRGRPSVIYSDNGTNFVGAQKLLKSLDWGRITRSSSVARIQWIFNPPAAAWWGGWWERVVQMVKKLLRRVLGQACLTYEEMLTVLCDAEAVINSRPLTYLTEDPEDLIPLTPAMFIQDVKSVGVPDLDNLDKINVSKRWRYHQRLRDAFRKRFRDEYLGLLVQHPLKKTFSKPVKLNDVVLVGCDNRKRTEWPMGRVIALYPGKDKEIRVVKVKTSTSELLRPVQRVYPLEVESESSLTEGMATRKASYSTIDDHLTVPDTLKEKSDKTLSQNDSKVLTTRSGRKIVQPERFCIT